MPTFRVSSTAGLNPDLRWLLEMEPTYDNLNRQGRFLEARPPCTSDAPAGIADHFTISNVFAGLPHAWTKYDYVKGGRLADAEGADLLYLPLPCPDGWPLVEHRETVRAVCSDLATAWGVGLLCYDHPGVYDHFGGIPDERVERRLLYFESHISLPDRALIDRLRDELDTWGLMLLTARHELGYLWRKVLRWHQDHTNPWLDAWDWGLITVRQRAQSRWVPGPVYAAAGNLEVRTARPGYPSSLAMLYASLGEVAAAVYDKALDVRTCKKKLPDDTECGNPVLPRRGSGPTNAGRAFKYCKKHTTSPRYRRSAPE